MVGVPVRRRGLTAWGVVGWAAVVLTGCGRPDVDRPSVEPSTGFAEVAATLERAIQSELADKGLPALSIALVNGGQIVWAKGFGLADPQGQTPATAETVYRVGSVSKLFTDIGVMQLVERGTLNLDAPVDSYIPEFHPHNPFGGVITLRQLMAHRSGLVREPPAGNYFDDSSPTLEATVASLNSTRLVYPPGSRTKYSNAAIAVVGYVIERVERTQFAAWLAARVLAPMGLARSGFAPAPQLTERLARARMWTYDGRLFAAPTFELGMAPAGSMYSTVLDLGKFISVLFARGRGERGQVARASTVERMWELEFAPPGATEGYGLGFRLSTLDGHRRLGHGGAIYGFATELAALPDVELGVVVTASLDGANSVTTRLADYALRLMLASQRAGALPAYETTAPLDAAVATALAGEYRVDPTDAPVGPTSIALGAPPSRTATIEVRGPAAYLRRGELVEVVRSAGNELVVDGRLSQGTRLFPTDADHLQIGPMRYSRVASTRPPAAPARWSGLMGEYGWDYNTLYVLERGGRLTVLIEWFFSYPLDEDSATQFWFPNYGLYAGEKVTFTLDEHGRASALSVGGVTFPRRDEGPAPGVTFHIKPLKPVEELRAAATAASPPDDNPASRSPELVDLAEADPTLRFDIRYATTNNFLGTRMYEAARTLLQRPAAEALIRAHDRLKLQGYGLLIHDAYRPWYVTKMFWDATPPAQREFVADPAQGSRHNRGCAVDLMLFDLAAGAPAEMTGGYDEFSTRSYPDYQGGTSRQRWHRELLRAAMEAEGFQVNPSEWWHFDYQDWREYPVLNLRFDDVPSPTSAVKPDRPQARRLQ